mmetsp:Transcript_11327/g.30621  ORF Transcript_11327/g.30621 Transcript_11327/m.30621 type:complete len:217 (-) Transcript_11327:481-1131(-)
MAAIPSGRAAPSQSSGKHRGKRKLAWHQRLHVADSSGTKWIRMAGGSLTKAHYKTISLSVARWPREACVTSRARRRTSTTHAIASAVSPWRSTAPRAPASPSSAISHTARHPSLCALNQGTTSVRPKWTMRTAFSRNCLFLHDDGCPSASLVTASPSVLTAMIAMYTSSTALVLRARPWVGGIPPCTGCSRLRDMCCMCVEGYYARPEDDNGTAQV